MRCCGGRRGRRAERRRRMGRGIREWLRCDEWHSVCCVNTEGREHEKSLTMREERNRMGRVVKDGS